MPSGVSLDKLSTLVAPGDLVYLPGASGAPLAFVDALLNDKERSAGLQLLTSYVPGINALDIERLHATAKVTGLFMQPGLSAAQRDGRYRALAMTYAGFVRHVQDSVTPDLTVVQVSPPDSNGRCSLGPAVEFMPEILKKSRRVLGLINCKVPVIKDAFSIAYEQLTSVCEVDTDLPVYVTDSDPATEAIAANIASLIPDGAALQVGLGKVPAALSRLLRSHRKLRLHSGMLSDGLIELAEAGALDNDFLHTTTVLVGSENLYSWLPGFDNLRVVGCEITHDLATLIGTKGLVSVNSALEVDLFGQCNLEHANGRAVSGCGGAPDFARGARMAPGGCSIVALNASFTTKGKPGKAGSRILPALSMNAIASLSRVDVDNVVTEFGIAQLRGRSVHERAAALIGVAAPEFRNELQAAWNDIAAKL
jgi:acyl-CoA hydrolase